MITLVPVATAHTHTEAQAKDIEVRCKARGCVIVSIMHPNGMGILAVGYHSTNLHGVKSLMSEFGVTDTISMLDTSELAALLNHAKDK